jgi:hypothetical protein
VRILAVEVRSFKDQTLQEIRHTGELWNERFARLENLPRPRPRGTNQG